MRKATSLEYNLKQKRERNDNLRSEMEEARQSLQARQLESHSKATAGKREERSHHLKEMETHMQYVEAINQVRRLSLNSNTCPVSYVHETHPIPHESQMPYSRLDVFRAGP